MTAGISEAPRKEDPFFEVDLVLYIITCGTRVDGWRWPW